MSVIKLFDPSARILVLGDVMLDGYASGRVDRISPEAPVPVLRHLSSREVPGGGANVAMNIAALGARPYLVGLVGEDDEAQRLTRLLAEAGVETRFVSAPERPTTFKLRILADNHQMLRIDKEEVGAASVEMELELLSAALAVLPDVSSVILSDYGKGCLTNRIISDVITEAERRGVPVFVDPKRSDFSVYAGATFITPNRSELQVATGVTCDDDESCRLAAVIAQEASGASILLTRSEEGMTLFPTSGDVVKLPAEVKEVFDVSGAGDSVIATFTLGIVSGLAVPQALRAANCAAGLVVSRTGTATTTEAEIAEAMDREHLLSRSNVPLR